MSIIVVDFNLLRPSGFSNYLQIKHSKIIHDARLALCVLYVSQERQRLLLYTSQPCRKVFTARYKKQFTFGFYKVN